MTNTIDPSASPLLLYTGTDPLNQPRWYAVYTRPHHEKLVYQSLTSREIEAYLPLIRDTRQWFDRKRIIEAPLIRGYVFVHITLRQSLPVLQTKSVVRFVTFNQEYAAIPDFQIFALQRIIGEGYSLVPCEYLQVGQAVEIQDGPLQGVRGHVQRIERDDRFVITIDHLHAAFVVSVDPKLLKPVTPEEGLKRISLPLGLSS